MNISYIRPYLYTKQKAFVDSIYRYTVVEASTKSGKTIGCLVWIFEKALQGKLGDNCWWVAPVYQQSKIAFRRLKRFIKTSYPYFAKFNESELRIVLLNGVVIQFKSGENPDNLYGDDVIGCVIDEATRCKKEVFYAIRSTLTKTKGKLKIIGNVKGRDNWVWELARKAEKKENPNWEHFKLTALDAVEGKVFSMEELEDARATLPDEIFNELYMAEAFDDRGKPFVWAFSDKNICDGYKLTQDLPLYVSFDFNVDPITATCHQHAFDKSWIRTAKEFRISNSNIYDLCDHIKASLGMTDFDFIVNGDASGNNNSALVKDNLNYFRVIQKELEIPSQNFNIPGSNPALRNSRMLTNSLFAKHLDCKVDRECKYTIEDLRYVQVLADGTIDKKTGTLTHLLDTVRYYHWSNHSDYIKNYGN